MKGEKKVVKYIKLVNVLKEGEKHENEGLRENVIFKTEQNCINL